jgi:Histidine kinase-, DNA gyrase B-, and HSP90-like ATPase
VIDDQQADDLAQPFRRAGADRIGSENGSGLGLSIVAAIAEAHGGRLNLRARPSGGLLVSIELPAAVTTSADLEFRPAIATAQAAVGTDRMSRTGLSDAAGNVGVCGK